MMLLPPFMGSGKPIPSYSPIFKANGFNSDANVVGQSARNVIKPPPGGWPKAGTVIKVIFGGYLNTEFLTGPKCDVEHVSIGKLVTGAYTQPNTQSLPIRLTFPDYVDTVGTLPNTRFPAYNLVETNELIFHFDVTDAFVVIIDFTSENLSRCMYSNSMPNTELWMHSGNSWTLATVTNYPKISPGLVGVVSIKAK
jgi:hypothetical protein